MGGRVVGKLSSTQLTTLPVNGLRVWRDLQLVTGLDLGALRPALLSYSFVDSNNSRVFLAANFVEIRQLSNTCMKNTNEIFNSSPEILPSYFVLSLDQSRSPVNYHPPKTF